MDIADVGDVDTRWDPWSSQPILVERWAIPQGVTREYERPGRCRIGPPDETDVYIGRVLVVRRARRP